MKKYKNVLLIENDSYLEIYIYIDNFKKLYDTLSNTNGYIGIYQIRANKHKRLSYKFIKDLIEIILKKQKEIGVYTRLDTNTKIAIRYGYSDGASERFKKWFKECEEKYGKI